MPWLELTLLSAGSTSSRRVSLALNTLPRILQIFVMLAVGAVALYLAFRGVDGQAFLEALQGVHVPTFIAGLGLFFSVHVCRSIRWGRLVQAVEPRVGFRTYFSVCSVGFFLINVLPFRLGEVVRPYLLFEREEIPFGSGVATVVVERVLDMLALGAIFVGALALADLPDGPVSIGGEPVDLVGTGRTAILSVLLPASGLLVVLLAMGDRGVSLAGRLAGLAGERMGSLVSGLLRTFLDALLSLGSLRSAVPVLAWTVITWVLNVFSILVMARGLEFGAQVGFWDAGAILSSICIFLILPAPPLFAGVFEAAVIVGVVLVVGTEFYDQAAAFSVLVHGSQFLLLSVLGGFFLVVDRISVRRLLSQSRRMGSSSPADDGSPPA